MVMMKGERQKKGREEEREAPGRKISHTCKSGQYKQDPQKGILPVSQLSFTGSPFPPHNTCNAGSVQTRLEDVAIFSGEMIAGQEDCQGSPLFILGVLAMACSLHCVLMQYTICPSSLHLSFISPCPRGNGKEDLAGKKSILPNETSFVSPPNS